MHASRQRVLSRQAWFFVITIVAHVSVGQETVEQELERFKKARTAIQAEPVAQLGTPTLNTMIELTE